MESFANVSRIAFVDAALPDYQTLVNGLAPNTAVYLLNPAGDELSQISQVLANYSNLSSVSVFSHGSDRALQLGTTSLNTANLMDYAGILQSWSGALSESADLLFYGCNLAADATGQSFISQIAALTGYSQLTVQQDGTRTRLLVTATGEVLAYLDNVNFNLIDITDFVVVS